MADVELQAVLDDYEPTAAGATASGTAVNLLGQNGGATSGDGGSAVLSGGDATLGNGGAARVIGGTAATGDGGDARLFGGDALDNGDGGDVTLTPGQGGSGSGVAGHILLVTLESFADDAAAATGGVPVTGLYRTASAVKVRVA